MSLDQLNELRSWISQQTEAEASRKQETVTHPFEPAAPRQPRTPSIAIASGKGGVGKTFLALNLAMALRDQGRKCLLADLDWGLANVDVALGLGPERHVGHVLAGECDLEDAFVHYEGLTLLPNACGESELSRLEDRTLHRLTDRLGELPNDVLLLDTHPGIQPSSVELLLRVSSIVLVTTPEPTSLTDSYALFKVLAERGAAHRVGLVVNQAASEREANAVAGHLDRVAQRYLGWTLPYLGCVPADVSVARSVQEQMAVLTAAPHAPAAFAVRSLAMLLGSALKLGASRNGAAYQGERKLCRAWAS